MQKKLSTKNNLILCHCGCGTKIAERNKWGYKRRFVKGHNSTGGHESYWKGKNLPEEHKRKISQSHIGIRPTEQTRQKMRLLKGGANHPLYGTHHSEEWNRKIGLANSNENGGTWKGDKVQRMALHQWVRKNLSAPKLCQMCNEKPHKDLANMTGIYNRDFSNWAYLCRSCHSKYDGIINNIKSAKQPLTYSSVNY